MTGRMELDRITNKIGYWIQTFPMSLENQVIYNIMIYHKHGLQSIVRDCLIRSPPSLLFPAPVQVRFRAFRLQTGSLAPDYARTADFCQRDFRYAAVRADSSVADGPTPEMCVVAASLPILGGFIPSLSVIKNSRPSSQTQSAGIEGRRAANKRDQVPQSLAEFASSAYPYLVRIQKRS